MPFFGVPIRNGLPIGLGSVAGFGVQQFDPSYLFSAGEQGTWYDPSDLTTLFQDSAGTTPVTGVEQVVGLMLDKSGNGNTATSTGAARPTLRARYNLLTYSEEFNDGAWTKVGATVTANAVIAPDGTTTADKLVENTSTGSHDFRQNVAVSAVGYVFSCYVQAAERSKVLIGDLNKNLFATYTLSGSGTVDSQTGGIATIELLPSSSWYRITISGTSASGSRPFGVRLLDGSGSDNYTGDGTSGIYIWGAQLLTAADAFATGNAYQRIAAATVYDTSNPVFRPYLAFGGTQAMSTGSIDFTATDKMTVFAGVTKLSDAAFGCLYELSVNFGSNNGSFTQFAPGSNYPTGFDLPYRGTSNNSNPGFAAAAPTTRVNTAAYNIGAPSAVVRSNGAQVYSDTNSAGSGNFGNYPLYIGARNLASLFLNGRIYSLITRGAQSTAAEISATEAWVNTRTGAF